MPRGRARDPCRARLAPARPWVWACSLGALVALGGCQAAAPDAAPITSAIVHAAPPARATQLSRYELAAAPVAGIPIDELSGLAWDADEQLLYAVSDRGHVFHFRVQLQGDALVASRPVYAAVLADPDATMAPRKRFNAEGLSVRHAGNGRAGDSELVVSLEGDAPNLIRFSPAGRARGELPLPASLQDSAGSAKPQRRLEAVAEHPQYGLLTGPEVPARSASAPKQPDAPHTLHARHRSWAFARHHPGSRLKAVEVLADGSLLVLERSRMDDSDALTASLRRVDIAGCARGGACAAETLAVFPAGPDNFEGMTLVGPGHVLVVSDRARKDPQASTLMLFALP